MDSAVAKAFAVLEALSRAKGPSRLSTLATDLDLQKSTVHRILGELSALGYVVQDDGTGLYRPTLRTWELGTAVVADVPIKQVASGALLRLHEQTGETVSLVVRSGDDALYLDKIISPRPVRFTTHVGSRVPLPITAGGKAILAASSDGDEVVHRLASRPGFEQVADRDRLLGELTEARDRGYAVATGRPGLIGIAAAIVDRDDEPVAALSVSAPTERLSLAARPAVIEAVLTTATHLAESIGRLWTAPVTAAVSDFVAGRFDVAPHDMESAGTHVLDTLASIVACRDLEPARVARAYATATSGHGGSVTILGTEQRASLVDAVFAGAMTGHAAEVNDFMPSVFVQPGPAIVSTALGLAEQRDLTGAAVVRAVVVGYELSARVPRALGAANLRAAGLASHGIGPVFGSAAAAASLLGLDRERIGDVLSCCAQQASGSWQWLRDVEHIEKAFVFAGMGARNGLQAALLVEAGFRGVRGPFDDPAGWFRSGAFQGGDRDTDALVDGLDAPTALRDTAIKRHPVGGPAQPAVEALLCLVDEIDADEVDRVTIAMPGRADAFRDAAMPALNLRYLAAVILVDGDLDVASASSLERRHHDPTVAARMAVVEVVHDPGQETGTGRDRAESARVVVTLRSGEVHERFVGFVAGYPTHPMSRAEVEAKAHGLLADHLGTGRADQVIATCARLAELDHAAELVPMIAR